MGDDDEGDVRILSSVASNAGWTGLIDSWKEVGRARGKGGCELGGRVGLEEMDKADRAPGEDEMAQRATHDREMSESLLCLCEVLEDEDVCLIGRELGLDDPRDRA